MQGRGWGDGMDALPGLGTKERVERCQVEHVEDLVEMCRYEDFDGTSAHTG